MGLKLVDSFKALKEPLAGSNPPVPAIIPNSGKFPLIFSVKAI
jgi:hypothetical protein